MSKLSTSPDRHTFSREKYFERLAINPADESALAMLEHLDQAKHQDMQNMFNPEWQKLNLEYDLRSTNWILEKVRASETYAQNLYAALCNNEFVKREMWPVLKDQRWSCSWRYAGGIIANMREQGDYIDWYCSGIGGCIDYEEELSNDRVPESVVTDEIETDLNNLGWMVIIDNE